MTPLLASQDSDHQRMDRRYQQEGNKQRRVYDTDDDLCMCSRLVFQARARVGMTLTQYSKTKAVAEGSCILHEHVQR
jgi:hypothetical protein